MKIFKLPDLGEGIEEAELIGVTERRRSGSRR